MVVEQTERLTSSGLASLKTRAARSNVMYILYVPSNFMHIIPPPPQIVGGGALFSTVNKPGANSVQAEKQISCCQTLEEPLLQAGFA